MKSTRTSSFGLVVSLCLAACGTGAGSTVTDAATATDAATGGSTDGAGGNACSLTNNTTPTAKANTNGCYVLTRDTSSCDAARKAAGLSGYWLKFSCRVSLASTAGTVVATSDGAPDYKSNYFPSGNVCNEVYAGGTTNPNRIATQSFAVSFPPKPDTTSKGMGGIAVVGLALNGVPIFGNFAAPQDDIYFEAMTFDRCGGHPENTGNYHYHCEPYAITDDDSNFVGVMRDGYPIYGRKDPDGTYPTIDAYGGHTGLTVDSPATAVYHYHINQQTSKSVKTLGQKQWFLTTGTFRGTPGACTGC